MHNGALLQNTFSLYKILCLHLGLLRYKVDFQSMEMDDLDLYEDYSDEEGIF